MLPILGLVGGAVVRYLPSAFGFLGGLWKDRAEAKREADTIRLQLELEERRAKVAHDTQVLQGELAEALATQQASLEEMRASLADRQGAREFGKSLHSAMVRTLAVGSKLGLPKWITGPGWLLVLGVEVLSASVQPMIAVCAFGMWVAWKLSGFHSGGGALAALAASWAPEDWELINAVLGFYLAGREIKHRDSVK